MKIAYISERSPQNINTWSGTPKHILSVLSQTNTVEWVGRDVTQGAFWHHRFLGAQEKFYVQDYADCIGRIVSEILCRGNYDIAITSSSTLLSHIRANIPIIFFTDAIFSVCQGVFFQSDNILESKVLPIEKAALERADRILLCSDFVQQAVVRVHGIPEEKTEVLEFGANKSFRINSRHEFEHRLNWNLWGKRVNEIMTKLVDEYEERCNNRQGQCGTDTLQEYYLPVYAFNLRSRPDRLANLKLQFENKPEFDVTYMEAVQHERGNVGLWKSICNAVRLAKERSEDLIVLCEDDHIFTEAYDKRLLIANIAGAYKQGAELLNCGIGGFGTAVPVDAHRSWVDWFWSTQFVVVFEPLFDKILSYDFQDKDTADGVLSSIASRPMVLHPAISAQMDYGYSDIAPRKNQSDFQNGIFRLTNQRLNVIHSVYNAFHTAK